MKRKIIFALAVVAVVMASISFVSAAENVTVDGIDFNVPDGFSENKSLETVNNKSSVFTIEYISNGMVFENGTAIAALLVSDYLNYDISDSILSFIAGDSKKIGNISGYMKEDNGYHVFSYEKNGKLVSISSTDENLIEDFLLA